MALETIIDWKMEVEDASSNCGTLLIAKNVTRDMRGQFYVATGALLWLREVLANEGFGECNRM